MALGRTRAELLRDLDAREYAEWLALDSFQPIGHVRQDYLFAALMQLVAALGGAKNAKLKDFLLFSDRTTRATTPDEMLAMAQLMTGWLHGDGNR